MQLLAWKDEFKTGIPDIDYEHENLVKLINELHANTLIHADKRALDEVLGEILAQISAHFALEEKIMRDIRYADYQSHKAEHEDLLDGIRDIMEDVRKDPGFDYTKALEGRLNAWFGNHFRNADSKFHRTTGH